MESVTEKSLFSYPSQARYCLDVIFIAAAYYLTGKLGILIAIPPGIATAIWFPSGIAIAVLLRKGISLWPGIFIASVILNFPVLLGSSLSHSWGIALLVAVFIATGSTLQAIVAAGLMRKFFVPGSYFEQSQNVFRFVAVGIFGCVIATTFGTTSLWLSGLVETSSYWENWLTWWFGDFTGILVVTPFLFVFSQTNWKQLLGSRYLLECFILLTIVTLCSISVFGFPISIPKISFPTAYAFFPILVLSTFRLGAQGTTATSLLVTINAILGCINGTTRFSGANFDQILVRTQIFSALLTFMGLLLNAVLSERNQKERLLQKAAKDLIQSNEDLSRFASIASHDLKEPLRTTNIYLSLLEKNLGAVASDEDRESFRFIKQSNTRMLTLIDGLLEISKVETRSRELKEIDFESILKNVTKNLQAAIEEKQAQVTWQNFPTLVGNRIQIEQLFQNLISNALKFTEKKHPQVELSAKKDGETWVFSVKDDGIGFDMRYKESIFDFFRKLHPSDKYKGSGLGLAVCKKIVEKHGGSIWVESVLEKGTTFYFTLANPASLAST